MQLTTAISKFFVPWFIRFFNLLLLDLSFPFLLVACKRLALSWWIILILSFALMRHKLPRKYDQHRKYKMAAQFISWTEFYKLSSDKITYSTQLSIKLGKPCHVIEPHLTKVQHNIHLHYVPFVLHILNKMLLIPISSMKIYDSNFDRSAGKLASYLAIII
jgi:hypothetical protein